MVELKDSSHQQAASIVKIQGMLAIILGGIGVVLGLIGLAYVNATYGKNEELNLLITAFCIVIFWLIPHVYFIISGVTLYRLPTPRVVKALTTVNLVIGAFLLDVVIVIAAIFTLVRSANYESVYKPTTRSVK